MISCLMILLGLLLALPAKAGTSLKTFERWQRDYAVILAVKNQNEYRNFCSGTISSIGIVTAAHCCPVQFGQEIQMYYSKTGETYHSISNFRHDLNGQDICIAKPSKKEFSPIKISDMPRRDKDTGSLKKDYVIINKISLIYEKESLRSFEVQNVYLLSIWDDETNIVLYRGTAMPGMSGSGIFDMKGNLVAVLTNGIFTDRGQRTGNKWVDSIDGVFGAHIIELTQWGRRGLN